MSTQHVEGTGCTGAAAHTRVGKGISVVGVGLSLAALGVVIVCEGL